MRFIFKFTLLLVSTLVISCGAQDQDPMPKESSSNIPEGYSSEGELIDLAGALNATDFIKEVEGKDSVLGIKLSTKINSCCKKKGCWMNVDLGNGEEMKVRFKDYAFFVPTSSAGSEVIIQGKAFRDTVSVEMLRHYAEDAGKSEEEINAITEPESILAFEATGLLLKN